ncbi:MAG: TadE/TadG family type IV pilus assembly protein [Candidatus Limnocylindrales bacterium]
MGRRLQVGIGERGQALAEFTLVVPILLILLLTVGDFGRFFAAGISVESIARTAAEYAAREYLREATAGGGAPLSAAGYARVHAYAWQTVCEEAAGLPGVQLGPPGSGCQGIPTVVCVHDLGDPHCANSYNDSPGLPAECVSLSPGNRPANAIGSGTEASHFVEVRVCYPFKTLIPIEGISSIGGPLAPLTGVFHIERARSFVVVDY